MKTLWILALCVSWTWLGAEEKKAEEAANDPAFHAKLLELAQGYQSFKRVDPTARLAPAACAANGVSNIPNVSASKDEQTHGRKLYYLFAKDAQAYLKPEGEIKTGQAVIKESWRLKESRGNEGSRQAGEKFALFIMYKLDEKTPGTDKGWVYGTVTPDGKTVTSSGCVKSCMGCHQDATHERLFGLKKVETDKP